MAGPVLDALDGTTDFPQDRRGSSTTFLADMTLRLVLALMAGVLAPGCDPLHGVRTKVAPTSLACIEQGLARVQLELVDMPERASPDGTQRWVAPKGGHRGLFVADISSPNAVTLYALRMHEPYSCASLSDIVLRMRAASRAIDASCGAGRASVEEHFIGQDRCSM